MESKAVAKGRFDPRARGFRVNPFRVHEFGRAEAVDRRAVNLLESEAGAKERVYLLSPWTPYPVESGDGREGASLPSSPGCPGQLDMAKVILVGRCLPNETCHAEVLFQLYEELVLERSTPSRMRTMRSRPR